MEDRRLRGRDYLRIALIYGFLYASLLIVLTELLWDFMARLAGWNGLGKLLIEAFFRTALLEELFKFSALLLADKKYRVRRRTDAMLTAAVIGFVFLLVEKLTVGGAVALIGLAFPMQVLLQLNQGRHYYDFKKARAQHDAARAKRELIRATLMIWLIHGCWIAAVTCAVYFLDASQWSGSRVPGWILLGLILAFGVGYTAVTVKKAFTVLRADRTPAEIQAFDENEI